MNWFEILSLVLNLALGGGLFVTFATLAATKREAAANADKAVAEVQTNELANVETAIAIWRKMAEDLGVQNHDLKEQLELLTKEVKRLTLNINKIVKLLDQLTPENLEQTVEQIKNEIQQ